ncbi:MAG TPA: protein jag [Firmicutes bacterium]|nr:protein jag [Bacillota bacterium]
MKSIEVAARTVEEAIDEALQKLEAKKEHVDITVLDEGNKGFLGIIGSKQARIRAEVRPNHELKKEAALQFLEALFAKMGVETSITGKSDEEAVSLQVTGSDLGILIGRRGQTLNSLQYITNLAVNRQGGQWIRINLDIGSYRLKREETLRTLAQRLAVKAETTGRRVALDPMNPAERRIVHKELQGFSGVETHSEGDDPHRRVIILPK